MKPYYFVDVDGAGDDTLWLEREGKDPLAILRECDLPPSARHLWPAFVAATGALPHRGVRMTPEQAHAAYEAISPEDRARFEAFVDKVCDVVTRVDRSLTDAGHAMADDAEAWLEGEETA